MKKFSAIFIFTLALAISGCASKKTATDSDIADLPENNPLELNGSSDNNTAGQLQTVNFDYDSAQLNRAAKSILDLNAAYLNSATNIKVQIEGHCDERGSVQYNLALGERRAKSVKNYLTTRGISSSRISTISFGKENPLDTGHDESAWSANRRGNFVITAQ
ncbi:MAG: peptidoglycan-associated lipoprotein Pal [Bacteriovoracaceae bacterium]|nr:peptidoglycan-associated lipoprotein Pal [Bacteriovoracaceae bacterium]